MEIFTRKFIWSHYRGFLTWAIYGLKQAPRISFEKFSYGGLIVGFIQSAYDYAIFVHLSLYGCTILLLYFDDTNIMKDGPAHIQCVKVSLWW